MTINGFCDCAIPQVKYPAIVGFTCAVCWCLGLIVEKDESVTEQSRLMFDKSETPKPITETSKVP